MTISHGGKLEHEVRHRIYRRGEEEVNITEMQYLMPTYTRNSTQGISGNEYLNEGQAIDVAGVTLSYKSLAQEQAERGEDNPPGVERSTVAITVGEDGIGRYTDGRQVSLGTDVPALTYLGFRTTGFVDGQWVNDRDRIEQDTKAIPEGLAADQRSVEQVIWRERLRLHQPGLHVVKDPQGEDTAPAKVIPLQEKGQRGKVMHHAS